MGMEKRTIKIIVIVAVVVLVIGGVLGLLLGLLLPQRYVVLEVWPRSEESTWDQPLIHIKYNDPGSWHKWYQRINEFLREYESQVPESPPRAPCTTHNRRDPQVRSEACERAMTMWQPCNADYFYGYDSGRPCVFLRLSNVHYWVPQPYNVTSSLPIPSDMPQTIRQAMVRYPTGAREVRPAHQYGDFIWVWCDGEFNSDKENLGPVQYIPAELLPGFPTNRLHTADRIPYAERYLPDQVPAPLVAVYFENPRRGVLINVECRIWTRDIYYDRSSRSGRARFELFIE